MQNGDVQKRIENYANAQDGTPSRDGKAVSGVNLKVYPSKLPSVTTPPKKTKKIVWIILALPALTAIIIVIWVAATIERDITIGDTVITPQLVDNITDEYQQYQINTSAENPLPRSDARELVRNKLIIDASLRDAANTECDINVDPIPYEEAGFWGVEESTFSLKKQLADCLLGQKTFFVIRSQWATSAFFDKNQAQLQEAFAAQKTYLEETFMFMFEANVDIDIIANSATVNLLPDTPYIEPDLTIPPEQLTFASIMTCNFIDPCLINGLEESEYTPVGLKNVNEQFMGLQEIGEHTEVDAYNTGFFMIARLVGIGNGRYMDWSEFEGEVLARYA